MTHIGEIVGDVKSFANDA